MKRRLSQDKFDGSSLEESALIQWVDGVDEKEVCGLIRFFSCSSIYLVIATITV